MYTRYEDFFTVENSHGGLCINTNKMRLGYTELAQVELELSLYTVSSYEKRDI